MALRSRRPIRPDVRVDHLIQSLDELVGQWAPDAVACCQPTGIGWEVPALRLLDAALVQWAGRRGLPFYAYTSQEVRTAVVGHPNASRDELGYAVMERFGMIGQSKTSHEWEAIAVGDYHLASQLRGSVSG